MADLIDLIAINRRYQLEDGLNAALAARRARRRSRSQASIRGWETRRSNGRISGERT